MKTEIAITELKQAVELLTETIGQLAENSPPSDYEWPELISDAVSLIAAALTALGDNSPLQGTLTQAAELLYQGAEAIEGDAA